MTDEEHLIERIRTAQEWARTESNRYRMSATAKSDPFDLGMTVAYSAVERTLKVILDGPPTGDAQNGGSSL
ncbi:hypothetical protein ACFWOB_42640 [Streptomyces sp. NPDC058420]|uniref:hypothetical protein n=1 Tax=Streptomyces sp. NPDC058420 TaxID=3346489 RepID=UPI00364F9FB2